jgi:heme-degrading monooxygenase HmoA
VSVMIVNRLTLTVPVGEVIPEIERAFPPAFDACKGFVSFTLVETGEKEAVVLIKWASAKDAVAGAETIGPGVFKDVIGPHLEDQDRRIGEIVLRHGVP